MLKPRNEQGKIITNISDRQFIAGVNQHLNDLDIHKWKCWRCQAIYDVEPRSREFANCPCCGADPIPF